MAFVATHLSKEHGIWKSLSTQPAHSTPDT